MANTQQGSGESRHLNVGKGVENIILLDFFREEIQKIYYSEKYIIIHLHKMITAASSMELKEALQEHLDVSKYHLTRLENVFQLLGKKPQAIRCEAIEGIIKGGESMMNDTEEGTAARDVGIILSAKKVEHFEIATYGGMSQLAFTLGLNDVAVLLSATLEEEKEADSMLSGIAESDLNYSSGKIGESINN